MSDSAESTAASRRCEKCNASFEDVCIRLIQMKHGDREPLCEPCFKEALEEGLVSPEDERLDTEGVLA